MLVMEIATSLTLQRFYFWMIGVLALIIIILSAIVVLLMPQSLGVRYNVPDMRRIELVEVEGVSCAVADGVIGGSYSVDIDCDWNEPDLDGKQIVSGHGAKKIE